MLIMNTSKPIEKPKDINNKVALKRKYDKIKLDYDWIERLDLVNDPGIEIDEKDVDNDFNREQLL